MSKSRIISELNRYKNGAGFDKESCIFQVQRMYLGKFDQQVIDAANEIWK